MDDLLSSVGLVHLFGLVNLFSSASFSLRAACFLLSDMRTGCGFVYGYFHLFRCGLELFLLKCLELFLKVLECLGSVLEAPWERLGLSWRLLGSLADFHTM